MSAVFFLPSAKLTLLAASILSGRIYAVLQALFGMQDDKTKWSLTVPLTPEQLAWWQERMRHTIYHVRQRFPKARLVFRKLHRTDDAVAGTQYITNCASCVPLWPFSTLCDQHISEIKTY